MDDRAHAWPLIAFTVVGPTSVGCLLGMMVLAPAGAHDAVRPTTITVSLALGVAAVLFSLAHLTKPQRAYRALRRFPASALSREIAAYSFYLLLVAAAWLAELASTAPTWLVILTVLSGAAAVIASAQIYLLPARPTWRHWSTVGTFLGCSLSLGVATSLLLALAVADRLDEAGDPSAARWLVVGGIALSALSLTARAAYLRGATTDTRAAWRIITTHDAGLWWLRLLLGFVVALAAVVLSWSTEAWLLLTWPALAAGELLDRRLFFVSVVPLSFRTEIQGVG